MKFKIKIHRNTNRRRTNFRTFFEELIAKVMNILKNELMS